MHVAMIVNSFPAISEKFLVNTIAKLIDNGIDVDIYAAVASSDSQKHDLYTKYNLAERTIQLNIPVSMKKRILKLPLVFARNIFRHPIHTIRAFCVSRYRRAAKNMKTLYFLDAFSGKHYDVIHCQFGQNGLIGAFLKDCGFCKKLVVTFHGSDITVFPKKEGADVYSYMFTRADVITAGTLFTSKCINLHGCPQDKISIIPAGIIPEDYPATQFEKREPQLVLSVGRLEEVKGFPYAIKAFSAIANDFPNARYIIAGAGSRESELRAIIADEGLIDRVFLVGEKKDSAILELYQRASVFLAASIRASNGSEEGQGLVIQEAEISGIPVIGTLTGGIPDGIRDGLTGFLVPEKDSNAIAEKIRYLFNNPGMIQKIGECGKTFALENYSMNVLVEKIILLYGSEIEQKEFSA